MTALNDVIENLAIDRWVRELARSPQQLNRCHETDAEIIALPGQPDVRLAITIDTVAEEIAAGIYCDPFTMGWVSVMASLSDLAAVGADPLGLVVAISSEPDRNDAFLTALARGIADACRAAGTFVLGGDTNSAASLSLTACAVGILRGARPLTRVGCRPGDVAYMTGRAGIGNALAMARLLGAPQGASLEAAYRPRARLSAGRTLRDLASACMDSSDGLLATLDQLMRLNGCGFDVECDWERLLAPEALAHCRATGAPLWAMLAAPHGEFELVFTVAATRENELLARCRSESIDVTRIGSVRPTQEIALLAADGRRARVDVAVVRNLLSAVKGDWGRYMREFRAWGERSGLDAF